MRPVRRALLAAALAASGCAATDTMRIVTVPGTVVQAPRTGTAVSWPTTEGAPVFGWYDYRPTKVSESTCPSFVKRSTLMQSWTVTDTMMGSLPVTKGPWVDGKNMNLVAHGPVGRCTMTTALVRTPSMDITVMALGITCNGVPVCKWVTVGTWTEHLQ